MLMIVRMDENDDGANDLPGMVKLSTKTLRDDKDIQHVHYPNQMAPHLKDCIRVAS